jgi:hypothetical protein
MLMVPVAVAHWRFELPFWALLCAMALLLAALGAWLETRLLRVNPWSVAEHLNRTVSSLEESAQLLLADDQTLQPLQRMQKTRVADRLLTMTVHGSLKHHMPGWPVRTLTTVLLGSILLTSVLAWVQPNDTVSSRTTWSTTAVLAGDLSSARVVVIPPAYTGLPARTIQGLDVEAEEGSQLQWMLQFDRAVGDVRLELDDESVIVAKASSQRQFNLQMPAQNDGIYRLSWQDESGPRRSPYQRIRVLRDQAPLLEVIAPERSPSSIPPQGPDQVMFSLRASDDFAIGGARILATVAKGEGEGVKFRDVELPFDSRVSNESILQLDKNWILGELDMIPGDELYFRAVVEDNRQPEPNRSQTAMWMVRWESDEEAQGISIEGIAVDLVPEYFRSQRQIIIDTEKLIAEADQISRTEGSDRSRGLAFDQKALRLRYGQFLGEEYSTDIGYSGEQLAAMIAQVRDEEHADESYAEHLEHEHEHEEEEDAPASATVESLPDFMSSFVHTHDSSLQATLFDEKTKETLKAALAAMWDAELELHLSRPGEALPHEYKALKLIKQVQQANRIYVRRAGFEPPPLDEEKRLTGELDEVQSYAVGRPLSGFVAAADLFVLLERIEIQRGENALTPELTRSLVSLRRQLGEAPDDVDLRLAIARLLDVEAETLCSDCLDTLQSVVWSRLPEPQHRAGRLRLGAEGRLGEDYLKRLELRQ